ncbi:hypothetical protein FOZ63_011376, partial [Perkinsus olseni]
SADVGHHHHHHQSTSTTTTTTLHVSNLTRNINEDHLYEIFGTFAEVVDVDLAIDDKVNLPKGYAHIILPNREAAKDAIYHLDHAQIDGNVINIRFAHNSGGGGGGGDKTRDHRDDEGSKRNSRSRSYDDDEDDDSKRRRRRPRSTTLHRGDNNNNNNNNDVR